MLYVVDDDEDDFCLANAIKTKTQKTQFKRTSRKRVYNVGTAHVCRRITDQKVIAFDSLYI